MVNSSSSSSQTSTFIQADASTFRELVQRLTGPTTPHKLKPKSTVNTKHSPISLQKRRKHVLHDLEMIKQLDVNSLAKSPGTPVGFDTLVFERAGTESPVSDEEIIRVVEEKGFYSLHALSERVGETPVLLTLFPLTSPN